MPNCDTMMVFPGKVGEKVRSSQIIDFFYVLNSQNARLVLMNVNGNYGTLLKIEILDLYSY